MHLPLSPVVDGNRVWDNTDIRRSSSRLHAQPAATGWHRVRLLHPACGFLMLRACARLSNAGAVRCSNPACMSIRAAAVLKKPCGQAHAHVCFAACRRQAASHTPLNANRAAGLLHVT